LNFSVGESLRISQLIGQGSNNLRLPLATAHKTSPRGTFHVTSHQTERKLVRQEFIIGQTLV
jgi:hypothetical protein